jgi:hypothetical protein
VRKTKFDMGGFCEERFEGLEDHHGASIRDERVEASNSCVRTLIFDFLSFIAFLLEFFLLFIHPFYFFLA